MPSGATIGIRDLKNQLSRFVARARRGQEITVTDRGAAVARLVPAGGSRVIDRLIAEGLVVPAPKRGARRRKRPRLRLRGRGPTMAEYVADQRR
jgi:prevent-host-death family protein